MSFLTACSGSKANDAVTVPDTTVAPQQSATAAPTQAQAQTAAPAEEFNVIFDVDAGKDAVANEPDILRVAQGEAAKEPQPSPEREGYEFLGWFDENGESFDFSAGIETDTVLYAHWEVFVPTYEVALSYGGFGADTIIEVEEGASVALPEVPDADDHYFGGWFLEDTFSTPFNATEAITADLSIYAKWDNKYSVTFDTGLPTAYYREGETVARPADPTKKDFLFAGWFTDKELAKPYTFAAAKENLTLFAKWTEVEPAAVIYKVTFHPNYAGAADVVKDVLAGSVAVAPEVSREGSSFIGWFSDSGLSKSFNLSSPVSSNLDLYAKWGTSFTLTINFNYDGSPAPQTSQVGEGSAVEKPANPTRQGYSFAGWSNQPQGDVKPDSELFPKSASGPSTVYALWSKTYVYEAEDTNLDNFIGAGFSGNAVGTAAIVKPPLANSANPSNGHFVSYMFTNDPRSTLFFVFNSDRAVENAELKFALSAEVKDYTIVAKDDGNPDTGVLDTQFGTKVDPVFEIRLNNTVLNYPEVSFTNVPAQSSGTYMPFADKITIKVNLKEGQNIITMRAANNVPIGGTMSATAPIVDCVKITTYANVTWTPKSGNY
jgi:uncharacterized repeat protein (TIGR02543 family)